MKTFSGLRWTVFSPGIRGRHHVGNKAPSTDSVMSCVFQQDQKILLSCSSIDLCNQGFEKSSMPLKCKAGCKQSNKKHCQTILNDDCCASWSDCDVKMTSLDWQSLSGKNNVTRQWLARQKWLDVCDSLAPLSHRKITYYIKKYFPGQKKNSCQKFQKSNFVNVFKC